MASYRVIGASASETPTLLWTNPSPLSNFSAQTINVNTSGYSHLIFVYTNRAGTSTEKYETNCILPNDNRGTLSCYGYKSNNNSFYTRMFTKTDTTITFTAGYSSRSSGTDTDRVIPIEIYGLKKALI